MNTAQRGTLNQRWILDALISVDGAGNQNRRRKESKEELQNPYQYISLKLCIKLLCGKLKSASANKMEQNGELTFNLTLSFIKSIEPFNGSDPNQLSDFISQVENVMPTISLFDNNTKRILFGSIKNKCTGLTRPAIHRHGNVTSWELLKEILIKNFGKKQDSDELMDLLKLCRVDSTIEVNYHKINEISNRLHNRILINNDNTYSTDEVNRIALRVFKANLPEPTKSVIFARNPISLDDAFKIIEEARHQNYTFYSSNKKQTANKTTFRTNFSNDRRNNNEQLLDNSNSDSNREQPNTANVDSTGPSTSSAAQQSQVPIHNSDASMRSINTNKNHKTFRQGQQLAQPMEIGHSDVNFQTEASNSCPT